MVTTMKQAKAIQQRRVGAGKPGIAKAVRRFLRRSGQSARNLAQG